MAHDPLQPEQLGGPCPLRLPDVARRYALPRALTESGIRRYGFHGLSYEYIAEELPRLMDDFPRSRVIAAHLGSGSSLCAMHGGRSVATTMGFTEPPESRKPLKAPECRPSSGRN